MLLKEFFVAIRDGKLKPVRDAIVKNPALINAEDEREGTALHAVSYFGQFEVLKLILSYKPEIKRDNKGATALHYAALRGHLNCIRALLDYGLQNDRTHANETPIQLASLGNHFECFLEIYNHLPKKHETPLLHLSAYFGNIDFIKKLIKQDHNINEKDVDEQTPLHLAVFNKKYETVQILLNLSADKTIKDRFGLSPRDYVAKSKDKTLRDLFYLEEQLTDKSGITEVLGVLANMAGLVARETSAAEGMEPSFKAPQRYQAQMTEQPQMEKSLLMGGLADTEDKFTSAVPSLVEPTPAKLAAFFEAIRKGNLTKVEKFLNEENGLALLNVYHKDITSLHQAAGYTQYEILQKLLESGAVILRDKHRGATPLHYVIASALNPLASTGSDLKSIIALFEAAKKGAWKEQDNDLINASDFSGITPLISAISFHKKHLVRLLMEAGAFLLADHKKANPFHHVVHSGHAEYIPILQSGVDSASWINEQDEYGITPLHWAVEKGDIGLVRALLLAGAHVVKDADGSTPVHYAAKAGRLDCLTLLLEYTQSPNVKNDLGKTPLRLASDHGYLKCFIEIFRHLQNQANHTALTVAVSFENVEFVKYFLKNNNNIDINFSGSDGRTALHTAVFRGNVTIVELLLKAGADRAKGDGVRKTPVNYIQDLSGKIKDSMLALFASIPEFVNKALSTTDEPVNNAKEIGEKEDSKEKEKHLVNIVKAPASKKIKRKKKTTKILKITQDQLDLEKAFSAPPAKSSVNDNQPSENNFSQTEVSPHVNVISPLTEESPNQPADLADSNKSPEISASPANDDVRKTDQLQLEKNELLNDTEREKLSSATDDKISTTVVDPSLVIDHQSDFNNKNVEFEGVGPSKPLLPLPSQSTAVILRALNNQNNNSSADLVEYFDSRERKIKESDIPDEVKYVINKILLNVKGVTQVYLTGGAVRDLLQNPPRKPKDYDLVFVIEDSIIKTMELIGDLFQGSCSFRGNFIQSIVLRINNVDVDIALLKKTKFNSTNLLLQQDHDRRDFTVNAILFDMLNYSVVANPDMEDLTNKKIKIIGNPEVRFCADARLILRGYGLASQGFVFDSATHAGAVNAAVALKNPSRSVLESLRKNMCSTRMMILNKLKNDGVLSHLSFDKMEDYCNKYKLTFPKNVSVAPGFLWQSMRKAITRNQAQNLRQFLTICPDVNKKDRDGNTLLDFAIQEKKVNCAIELILSGARDFKPIVAQDVSEQICEYEMNYQLEKEVDNISIQFGTFAQ